ncbi:hypothetical protein M422DRAFT_244747 [Sphaerobolus stellatus SS14]|nr:hypothetical protein M422DRAFT_244747 [Sphaerobolus stellatus SS14]
MPNTFIRLLLHGPSLHRDGVMLTMLISNGRFVRSDPGRPHSKFGRPRQRQIAQDQSGRPDVPGRPFPPSLMLPCTHPLTSCSSLFCNLALQEWMTMHAAGTPSWLGDLILTRPLLPVPVLLSPTTLDVSHIEGLVGIHVQEPDRRHHQIRQVAPPTGQTGMEQGRSCFSVHIPSVTVYYSLAQGTESHSPASSCPPTPWSSKAFGGRNDVAIVSNANGKSVVLVCSAHTHTLGGFLGFLLQHPCLYLLTHPQIRSPGGRTIDLLREILLDAYLKLSQYNDR